MTVYTGLLDEVIDGIPVVEPWGDALDDIRPMFELVSTYGAEDDECWCEVLLPYFRRRGVVCSGEAMRWQPGQPVARFDAFTPPYVAGVRRG